MTILKLVLASSSSYRRSLLLRLKIEFVTHGADINESIAPGESPRDLVRRLSIDKARTIAADHPKSLIIGSDQVIVTENGDILGKPGNHTTAIKQLSKVSGKKVKLITGLALYNTKTRQYQYDCVVYEIGYRKLTAQQIENYLLREKPYDCAGSVKSEGLGSSLLTYLRGDDPTAVIGLPLIALTDMLINEGVEIV